ncbi:MAG: DUF4260 domain-containing protein [Actinomycetota bacterium]
MVTGLPLVLLRIEGAAALGAAVFLYERYGQAWWLFAVLLLAPDLSAVGYLAGPRIGAYAYDLVHIELWPLVLIAIGIATDHPMLYAIGLIWIAHIGMDRVLGFGLKYPSAFGDTHLGKMGNPASA